MSKEKINASNVIDYLTISEEKSIDLDGNDKKEKIVAKYNKVASDRYNFFIKINDKTVINIKNLDDEYEPIYSAIINIQDKYKYILIDKHYEGDSDYIKIYKYKNGKLEKIFDTKNIPGIQLSESQTKYSYLRNYQINISKDGKVKKITKQVIHVDEVWYDNSKYPLSTLKKLSMHEKINKGKVRINQANTKFTIKKIHLDKKTGYADYMFIMNEKGKQGWVKIPNNEFLKEEYGVD